MSKAVNIIYIKTGYAINKERLTRVKTSLGILRYPERSGVLMTTRN
jgi:hypothetical protein